MKIDLKYLVSFWLSGMIVISILLITLYCLDQSAQRNRVTEGVKLQKLLERRYWAEYDHRENIRKNPSFSIELNRVHDKYMNTLK